MTLNDDEVTPGISIVCVFNDPAVRAECLDASIQVYAGSVDFDYIPIDNTEHVFTSAGAALNHGARLARHDVVVFVHQDVFLHSLDRLDEVGDLLRDGSWSMLGANGVAAGGENIGRIRDRAQLLGRPAPAPVDVESLDEVLFMVARSQILAEPLIDQPEFAWHAYGVEYALRMRAAGRKVGAVDLAVTHNSLTINLAKLDVAHRTTGELYPTMLPIHTTCGTIGVTDAPWRSTPIVRRYGWRLRWLRESALAWRVRRLTGSPVVLSDIRHEVDLITSQAGRPLHVINLDRDSEFGAYATAPLPLTRLGRPVVMSCVRSMAGLLRLLDERSPGDRVLVMGFDLEDLEVLGPRCDEEGGWLVGIHPDTLWLVGGVPAAELPAEWSGERAVPLGFRPAPQAAQPAAVSSESRSAR